jgi:nucleoside-diphosphate-sugar epimerase
MKTILVTGVTGHQGGAVAQVLQSSGFRLQCHSSKACTFRADTPRT